MAVNEFSLAPEILPFIQGYENVSLVSLEEAVKPLIVHVPDVERMVQTVKEYRDAPKDGLTHDESASILLYSMEWEPTNKSLCFILNTTLQKRNRQLMEPWFPYLRLIMTALAKLPSESTRFTVYRGVKKNLNFQLEKGSEIVWWAFSSCTMSVNVLDNERFLGNNGTSTLFIIDCYSGKRIWNHTVYPEEEEILLLPGCQFEVIGCLNKGNDLLVVQLKEIQPKYSIIKPVEPSKSILLNVTSHAPSPVPTPMVSVSSERISQLPLPAQRPFTAVKPVLPPIGSLNNPAQESTVLPTKQAPQLVASSTDLAQQPVMQLATQTKRPVTSKNRVPTKSSYNDNKPLEKRKALHIDPDLTELDLRDRLIGEKGAEDIAKNLKCNQTLKTLSLWYNEIKDGGVQYLADSLKYNKILTTLHLSYNEIGHQGAAYIANALQCNKTLTTLSLSYNRIGDQGAQQLADGLRKNTNLTILNLYSNQIGSQGAQYLASALEVNKKLTTLNLADNQIGDIGVQHIAHALRSNTTLTTLNLNNNQIGDDGAQHLGCTLKNFKNVEEERCL